MIALTSSLENRELQFSEVQEALQSAGFTIGGNWDYDHGSFDLALDEEDKVWLRLPFQALDGKLDAEKEQQRIRIQFGTPYVLKHLYNEGIEQAADMNVMGSLVSQFQKPVDPDASLEDEWAIKAQAKLAEVESIFA